MSKEMTKNQMFKKAMKMKKMMSFLYKHNLFGQTRAKYGKEDFIDTHHGKVRVLKYGFENEKIMPLYIDMHGGGFILMHADSDEAMNMVFSKEAGVKIVSIDYPKAPESPYPIAIESIHDILAHYVNNAGEYHLDISKIGIGGHSAGANMATVICMKNLIFKEFNLSYQVLDYPPLDIATSPFDKPTPKGCIPPKQAMTFNACYINPEHSMDKYVSPVFAKTEDLNGMPKTFMIVCGKDSLHDEGVKYAKMLQEAGTEVELQDYASELHGFTYNKPTENVTKAIRQMAEFIKINSR